MDVERPLSGPEELVDEQQGTLAVLARAEINQQIATAKAYPRSVTEFTREAEQLVTLNPDMARQCVYALPRGGKTIEGPSARFAEIMAYSFRNMRYGARPVMEEEQFITSQGVAYDLERNNGITIEVRRRITDKDGRRFNEDMISVTANAANSIALRNAVLKIVPKALWNPLYLKARGVIMGDIKTFNNRLDEMFAEFVRYGVTKEMICAKMNKKGVKDIIIDDMVVLAGMLTALQEGDTTAEQLFQGAVEQVRQPQARVDTNGAAPQQEQKPPQQPAPQQQAPAQEQAQEQPKRKRAAPKKDEPPAQQQSAPEQPPAQQREGLVTQNMVKQIKLRVESYGADMQKLRAKFGVAELEQLEAAHVGDVLKWIEENAAS